MLMILIIFSTTMILYVIYYVCDSYFLFSDKVNISLAFVFILPVI